MTSTAAKYIKHIILLAYSSPDRRSKVTHLLSAEVRDAASDGSQPLLQLTSLSLVTMQGHLCLLITAHDLERVGPERERERGGRYTHDVSNMMETC